MDANTAKTFKTQSTSLRLEEAVASQFRKICEERNLSQNTLLKELLMNIEVSEGKARMESDAETIDAVKEKLDCVMRTLLNTLEAKNSAKAEAQAAMETLLRSKDTIIAEQQTKLQTAKEDLTNAKQTVSAAERECLSYKQQMEALQKELENKTALIDALSFAKSEMEADKAEILTWKDRCSQAVQAGDLLQKRIAELEDEARAKEKETAEALQVCKEEHYTALESLKQKLEDKLEQQKQEWEDKLANTQTQAASKQEALQQTISTLQADLSQVNLLSEKRQMELSYMAQEKDRMDSERKKAEAVLLEKEDALKKLEERCERYLKKVEDSQDKLQQLQEQLISLKTAEKQPASKAKKE